MLRSFRLSAALLWGSSLVALAAGSACSAGDGASIDADGDGLADDLGSWVDEDGDGLGDPVDLNGDGSPDGPGVDTDGDGVADAVALDTDGDGIFDALDRDGDGVADQNSTRGETSESGGTGGGTNADFEIEQEEPEPPPDCDNILEIIVRDFNREHPDFGGIPRVDNPDQLFIGDEVRRQLVSPDLGADRKPVFLDALGCAAPPDRLDEPVDNCANWTIEQNTLTTPENFQQWYLDTEGHNISFEKTIELEDQGGGVYVFDSDAFFPLSTDEGYGETTGDSADNVTPGYNFLFTTEIHLQFDYTGGENFTFRGDDDLWVFVNGKLALDLGSMHAAREATIDFDAQAEALGIERGKAYAMDIFHAERRWNESNFRIETNISCFVPDFEGVVR